MALHLHPLITTLCYLLIYIPASASEWCARDSLPSYADIRTWEISKEIHHRISATKHDYPEEFKAEYSELYANLYLRLRRDLEEGNFIFDQELDGYVSSIVNNLNAQLSAPIDDLIVLISKKPIPNAVSLGNGILEIYFGLFAVLENTQQLSFILAHELAHEHLDHPRTKIDTSMVIFDQDAATKGLRKLASPMRNTRNVGAVLLRKSLYKSLHFSRQFEREADSLAFLLAIGAGYNPMAAISALEHVQYHAEVDSSFDAVIQSVFSILPIEFDSNWLQNKKVPKSYHDLSIHYHPDSLKTHPDYHLRIQQVIDYLQAHGIDRTETPLENTTREDSIFERLKHESKVFSLGYYQGQKTQIRGLQMSLKWIHQDKRDSLANAYAASYLMDIWHAKVKHQFILRFSEPSPFFQPDYNTLLTFCYNLTIREFAQLCLQFYEHNSEFIAPLIYRRDTQILQEYLQPQQSYKEWRAAKKANRGN